jgi:hypothetical protein
MDKTSGKRRGVGQGRNGPPVTDRGGNGNGSGRSWSRRGGCHVCGFRRRPIGQSRSFTAGAWTSGTGFGSFSCRCSPSPLAGAGLGFGGVSHGSRPFPAPMMLPVLGTSSSREAWKPCFPVNPLSLSPMRGSAPSHHSSEASCGAGSAFRVCRTPGMSGGVSPPHRFGGGSPPVHQRGVGVR